MSTRELKKILADSIRMEQELYDFCIECLGKLYGEDAQEYINRFEEGLGFFEYNGCIQSLCCIESNIKTDREAREARKNSI